MDQEHFTLKPIETNYNGYRFRSRLEARWAVYFDTMGIEFHYEMEGFELKKVGRYLPDFWLPQVKIWAEVKPVEFSQIEYEKCLQLVLHTGFPCLLLVGPPHPKPYEAITRLCIQVENCNIVTVEEYALSTKYLSEGRFYGAPACQDLKQAGILSDVLFGVSAARKARFGT